MANEELKVFAKKCGIPLWRVALSLGISEATLNRWLRVELQPEKLKRIYDVIETLSKEVSI